MVTGNVYEWLNFWIQFSALTAFSFMGIPECLLLAWLEKVVHGIVHNYSRLLPCSLRIKYSRSGEFQCHWCRIEYYQCDIDAWYSCAVDQSCIKCRFSFLIIIYASEDGWHKWFNLFGRFYNLRRAMYPSGSNNAYGSQPYAAHQTYGQMVGLRFNNLLLLASSSPSDIITC